MGLEGAEAIARMLPLATALTTLGLSYADVGAEGARGRRPARRRSRSSTASRSTKELAHPPRRSRRRPSA